MKPGESKDEVPAVRTAEFRPHPEDDSGPVGVRFVDRMDLCILADPCVVSGWVEKRLGNFELVKVTRSRLVKNYCFLGREGVGAPDYAVRDKYCDLLCSPEQGAVERSDNGGVIQC